MVRVLSDPDIKALLDLGALLPVIEDAFVAYGDGRVVLPDRPHYDLGHGLIPDRPNEPTGRGLVMPAYIHGADYTATKLVAVHETNPDRGLPTVQAQIVLTDARTGEPAGFLAGTRITNARTGCIGGLAARELATDPDAVHLGLIGAGAQARWHARAIHAASTIEDIRVYSPSHSRDTLAADLHDELAVPATGVSSPEDAVAGASVIVTATTAREPVFPGDALDPGTVVVGVGAYSADTQELDTTTMQRAARVYADNPPEVAGIGDIINTGFDPDRLKPFSAALTDPPARDRPDDIIVVESVGTAILDAATAEFVYDNAVAAGAGETIDLAEQAD